MSHGLGMLSTNPNSLENVNLFMQCSFGHGIGSLLLRKPQAVTLQSFENVYTALEFFVAAISFRRS
jgi:hypothetical protein